MSAVLSEVEVPTRVFVNADMTTARHELVEEVLHGKTVGGFDFAAMLDCELNSDGYSGTVHDLSKIATQLYSQEASAGGVRLAMLGLATAIVERHLPQHLIDARAEQIAAERAEEARTGF